MNTSAPAGSCFPVSLMGSSAGVTFGLMVKAAAILSLVLLTPEATEDSDFFWESEASELELFKWDWSGPRQPKPERAHPHRAPQRDAASASEADRRMATV